jgi:large subunit ribosomal protein L5
MSEQKKQDKKPGGGGKTQGGGGKPQGGGQKKEKKPKGAAAEAQQEGDDSPKQPAPPARLQVKFREEIAPALQKQLGIKNLLAVPRVEKIVISMGLGKAVTSGEKGKMEQAEKELGIIAGQKVVRCKAKKSVANFKVREGQETGLKVTLRGTRMYEFLDRMISLAFPRVKDFRGVDPKGFDKNGNYNFGFNEQTVFPEIDGATVTFQQGMNVTLVTTAQNPDHGRELLKQFGWPFRDDTKKDGK